jgi:hypothetical protein
MPVAELALVAAMFLITICLCALAIYAIARVTRVALDRFGLDFMTVLLWLGLAERPANTRR